MEMEVKGCRNGEDKEGDTEMENVFGSSHSLQENDSFPGEKQHGGWRAIKYILGNEAFEKLASMALIANLTVYLKTKYNMDGILLVNVYNVWSGSSNVTPLVGAFLSDAYLGRFHTLLYGSIASFLGMSFITLTAMVPQLRPQDCVGEFQCQHPEGWQLAVLYLGLGLLAIGAGGIRPCNIAFGADQFDTRTEKGKTQLESFFNWWYLSFTVALIVALTVVVYIQTDVSWIVGYAMPTACLFISISLFLLGKSTYIITKPEGSVFVDIAKVIVAAWRKRRVRFEPASGHLFYDPPVKETEQVAKLVQTNKFRFLDKAAIIVEPSEVADELTPNDPWRLCSVQQVEQLKLLLGIVPVWFTGIACFITMDQMNTFGLMQAIQSNNLIGNFKVPPGWMGIISMMALSVWLFFYEQIYLTMAKKMSKKDKRMTMRQRINTGIVMAILCMLVAAIVEKERREAALRNGSFVSPLSILALLPQFALSGLNEAFAAVAIMEFFSTHLPETMRTVAGAIFFFSFSMASYINTALVNIVHKVTGGHGKSPWLGGHDLNQVNLDNFYFLIAGLATVNLVYFNFFSCQYLVKRTEGKSQLKDEEQGLEMKETGS